MTATANGDLGTRDMAISFLNIDGGEDSKLDDEEIRLGEPIDAEGTDLALHVNRCATRYRMVMRRQNRLERKQDKLFYLGIALMLAIVILSPPVTKLFGFGP